MPEVNPLVAGLWGRLEPSEKGGAAARGNTQGLRTASICQLVGKYVSILTSSWISVLATLPAAPGNPLAFIFHEVNVSGNLEEQCFDLRGDSMWKLEI